jgi:hypothetical protein
MSTFPNSPRLLKGGLVLLDADSGAVQRVIALQYNPDTLTRSLQVQGAATEGGDRSEALRLKGPPIESIKLDAEIDAADQLEFPEQNPKCRAVGHSSAARGAGNHRVSDQRAVAGQQQSGELRHAGDCANAGAAHAIRLEPNRVVPVRLTEFSVTEEAFDAALNPIRAKVSLGMRVLSVNDLGFDHKGGSLYLGYQQQKERLAALYQSAGLRPLGLGAIP